MYHLVAVGKSMFVLGAGVAAAVASGGVHPGVTTGQLLAGGGGVMAAIGFLKFASDLGALKQMVLDHDRSIRRLENNEDAKR